ncbi:hypothetical protein EMGBS15_15580 [Filimonas sp.]|nr:hypothetical protein EMGBS15_15580 [Filimonas sp.]
MILGSKTHFLRGKTIFPHGKTLILRGKTFFMYDFESIPCVTAAESHDF